jgi:glycosyltransferase involved in cell wall biosynthesis
MEQFGRSLIERWGAGPPDVVHAHFWMSGLAALQAARSHGIPVVETFHALGSVKRRHQGAADTSPSQREWLEPRVATEVDAVTASSTEEVFELRRFGVAPRAVTVIPSGVDTRLFTPDGPVAVLPRSRPFRLLCLGRLVARKGVQHVIDALARMPTAELVVAGGPSGHLDADPDVCRLRARANSAGVTDQVRFLGPVEREAVPALIRSADIVVCTPWYEPFGIVPLEAMGCGVPVVVSGVGGLRDTVVDGRTGDQVEPRRPDVLAATLTRLLHEPGRRAAYAAAGLRRVRSRYEWDRIAGMTSAVYERTLNQSRAASVCGAP